MFGVTDLKSPSVSVDLPAPVRPTMPSLSRGATVQVTSRSAGSPDRYPSVSWSSCSAPVSGHVDPGPLGVLHAAS